MPITPKGSFIASVTCDEAVECTCRRVVGPVRPSRSPFNRLRDLIPGAKIRARAFRFSARK